MKLADYVRIMGIELRETIETPDIESLKVVKNEGIGSLESLDDDASIMDVPLRLGEACSFDFDKHMDAIVGHEQEAVEEHKRYSKLNSAQENSKEYDRRYKERPLNRVRYRR